jgi:hypothetical protein
LDEHFVEERKCRYVKNMAAKKSMRVLGAKNTRLKWERFNQMQRDGQVMLGDHPHPKGVFRFKTWREFNKWKSRCWIRFKKET